MGGTAAPAAAEADPASATTVREVLCIDEGYLAGVDGERTDDIETARFRQPTNSDNEADNTRSTTADSTVFPNSSGAEDDTPEAPQSGVEARRNPPKGGGVSCGGGGSFAGAGSDSLLDVNGIAAKVKTRHSPKRKLPAYLSASPNGFGAASRWGALSKAHLEFHRLDTAGEYQEEWG